MTTRERSMAIFLMGLVGIIGGGFIGYRMVYRPYATAKESIATLEDEITDLETKQALAAKQLQRLRAEEKLSLPADAEGTVTVARYEYQIALESLMAGSDFLPKKRSVTVSPPESKSTGPFYSDDRKKLTPIFTTLNVNVQAEGTLANIVSFLWKFYRQPLLHRVKNLVIERPKAGSAAGGTGASADKRELILTMKVEALVLDKADHRQTLDYIPTPIAAFIGSPASYCLGMLALKSPKGNVFTNDETLATAKREYTHIAWKDTFYGKEKEEPKEVAAAKSTGPEVAPYIRFTSVVSNTEGRVTANLKDLYYNHEYTIDQQPDGSYLCTVYYYKGDTKKIFDEPSPYFAYGSEDEGNLMKFEILGIDVQGAKKGMFLRLEDKAEKARLAANFVLGGPSVVTLPGKVVFFEVGKKASEVEPQLSRAVRLLVFEGTIQLPPPPKSRESRGR